MSRPSRGASRAGGQEDHPTVRRVREAQARGDAQRPPEVLDEAWLREVCLECGADDVGFVSLGRPELDDQRQDILHAFPHARSVIVFVRRMNREPVRSPLRSLANTEFHHVGDGVTATSHEVARRLEEVGVRALNEPVAFPMEQDRWPKPWTIALKPLAVAAGLGQMGIHRNVIHPRFGSFVLLGAVVVDRPVGGEGRPVDFNPCFECKLCVAACPVGAISTDGDFNFNSCFTHNYREFMGGFSDWVETVVDSKNAADYRSRVSDPETVSMWQSLSGGPNYKAANCVAVCPAGEDVIGPFLEDRKGHLTTIVKTPSRQDGDRLRGPRDRRGRLRRQALPVQEAQAREQRRAGADGEKLPRQYGPRLPARSGRRARRHLPLYFYRRRGDRGHRRDPGPEDSG